MVNMRPKRRRLRVTTVIGETLIIAGLGVFGYIVWQPWHTGVTVQNEQRQISSELSDSWDREVVEEDEDPEFTGTIPVVAEQQEGDTFAIIHVPSFGKSFQNVVAEGVIDWMVLNPADKGVGRYPQTNQFGEVGNVALSAHRSGPYTTPFKEIMELRVGDPVFIETPDGWYTYRHRSLEYVLPNEVDVLNRFPRIEGAIGEDRILSMITCHPKNLGIEERAVAYSVFESFLPRSEGPPEELLRLNPALGQEEA